MSDDLKLGDLPPITLAKQAAFMHHLVDRCRMQDGHVSDGAWLYLEFRDIQELERLGIRLDKIAPMQEAIEAMVKRDGR